MMYPCLGNVDVTLGWISPGHDVNWIANRVWVTGCTRERKMHGVLGRLLRRDRSSTGLAPSFVFRCWLPRASTGRLRAARSADRRRLCVRSLSLSLSPSLSLLFSVYLSGDSNAALLRESDALPVAVRQQLDRRNRRRWRDRPACPRRNGSPRLLQV